MKAKTYPNLQENRVLEFCCSWNNLLNSLTLALYRIVYCKDIDLPDSLPHRKSFKKLKETVYIHQCPFAGGEEGWEQLPGRRCQRSARGWAGGSGTHGSSRSAVGRLSSHPGSQERLCAFQERSFLLKKNKDFFSATNSDNKLMHEESVSDTSSSAQNSAEPSSRWQYDTRPLQSDFQDTSWGERWKYTSNP